MSSRERTLLSLVNVLHVHPRLEQALVPILLAGDDDEGGLLRLRSGRRLVGRMQAGFSAPKLSTG